MGQPCRLNFRDSPGHFRTVRTYAEHVAAVFCNVYRSDVSKTPRAIIWASEDYAGLAWVCYDAAHQRHAAANENKTWSKLTITGKAQRANRCNWCLAASHVTKNCALASEGDPDLPIRLKTVKLQHACKVVRPGRTLLRRVFEAMKVTNKKYHLI